MIVKALRRLKLEVKTQKEETVLLRKALQDCEACKVTAYPISKPYQASSQTKPNQIAYWKNRGKVRFSEKILNKFFP
jgi:hypothetical protein